MWNLYVEPSFRNVNLHVEHLEPFKSGNFMWNLGELGARFPALPQTTPKLYWKNPKLFKLLGKNANMRRGD